MRYKNCGSATLTFYGIEFKPGDSKDVPGPIMNKNFIRVKAVPKTTSKTIPHRETKIGRPKQSPTSTSKKSDPAPKTATKENE